MALGGNKRTAMYALEWGLGSTSRAVICNPGGVVFPERGAAISTNRKSIMERSAIPDPNLMGVFPRYDLINSEFLLGYFDSFQLENIAPHAPRRGSFYVY